MSTRIYTIRGLKPRIRKGYFHGWVCYTSYKSTGILVGHWGAGTTPTEAYSDWLVRNSARVELTRTLTSNSK